MADAELEYVELSVDSPDTDIDDFAKLLNASRVDEPWHRETTRLEARNWIAYGYDLEPRQYYLVRLNAEPVATYSTWASVWDNPHLVWARIDVHPDHQRRGIGTAVTEHVRQAVKAAGKTSIGSWSSDSEAARGFLAAHNMSVRATDATRQLTLDDPDRPDPAALAAEAAQAAADYDLIRIEGATDPKTQAKIATLANSINDAPRENLDVEDELFTQQRLADFEAAQTAFHRLYRVFARHRESGDWVGQTVVAIDFERPDYGHQYDTTVVSAHRGHRLGLLLKADMLVWLADAEPQLKTMITWNSASNPHMISVNERLGYKFIGYELQAQTDQPL